MSHTWKVLFLTAFAVLGAFVALPGGVTQPATANAYDCSLTHTLRIEIQDIIESDRISEPGSVIRIDPDPQDASNSRSYVDDGTNDDSSTTGRIDEDDACETEDDEQYTIELISLPDDLECTILDDELTTAVTDDTTVTFEVVNCEASDEDVTPTTTVGPVATVNVDSSNNTLGCGATSIVTVTVLDSEGEPVSSGTLVNILADLGTVSPTSGQTTEDGSVFVFYTAPADQGGTATITAIAGDTEGDTQVAINCNEPTPEPTEAPPPTTAPGGGITPPDTGSGGLTGGGTAWQTYAGIGVVLAAVITTLAAVRSRG